MVRERERERESEREGPGGRCETMRHDCRLTTMLLAHMEAASERDRHASLNSIMHTAVFSVRQVRGGRSQRGR